MSRNSNLKRKQKRRKGSSRNTTALSPAKALTGQPWSELKAAEVITDLYDGIVATNKELALTVDAIGVRNLEPHMLTAVNEALKLYENADSEFQKNAVWIGRIFFANQEKVQPASRDAELLAKVDELVDYLESAQTLLKALLVKLTPGKATKVAVNNHGGTALGFVTS